MASEKRGLDISASLKFVLRKNGSNFPFRKNSNGIIISNILSARTSVWESVVVQETEEANLTSYKEEHSNLNSVSQQVQSPISSLYSAKRRQDMIESDSNSGQAERFHTMYNYEFSCFIFKLVLARCPLVAGLESGFVFHYARPFIMLGHSLCSAYNFMVLKKLKLI